MERPNGLCFSPDEKRLYVVDTPDGTRPTHVYDMVETARRSTAGCSSTPRTVSPTASARYRGQCLGGFSGGEGQDGVAVFAPDGTLIGRILLPERCANLCFGGRKRNRLFMTASQSVYALYVEAIGVAGG